MELEAVSVLYDVINDFWLKDCLKEKIVKFMERKECNAEGKTSACQKKQALFQLCFTKFSQNNYTYQMWLSYKTKKSFQKGSFLRKLKNIS